MIALVLGLALAQDPVHPDKEPAPVPVLEVPPEAAAAAAQPEPPAPEPPPVVIPGEGGAVDPALEGATAVLPEAFGPPGPPVRGEALDAITDETALGLRCPSCQGLSVAESPATSARTMKQRIRDLLAAGYSREQVEAYFVSRYGEWILLDPPVQGLSWALWVCPGLGIGGVFAWALAVGLRWREEEAIEGPTEEFLVPKDAFEKRILEEIE